jgi:hypothetical protein
LERKTMKAARAWSVQLKAGRTVIDPWCVEPKGLYRGRAGITIMWSRNCSNPCFCTIS